MVPLQAAVDDGTATPGELTFWAQVAPHRPQGNKQHFLRPAPVPLLPVKASPLDGKLVKVEKPASTDADGKETSPAQNRVLNQRVVPTGCKVVAMDKDGSCLYRAIAQGLTWLSGKKKTEHCHRDLRARADAHLRRHQSQYVDEWDGCGPALEKLEAEHPTKGEAFTKYLDLAEKESAYGSVLELKALSRIYDVCLMVIPRDANFGTMVFKEAKAQKHRAIVLWYTPKHIDLVMPDTPSEHYPEALFAGSTGQIIDLRAGGRSSHPDDDEASLYTRASNAPSTQVRSQASKRSRSSQPVPPLPSPQPPGDGLRSPAGASIRSGTVWSSIGASSKKPRRGAATRRAAMADAASIADLCRPEALPCEP